MANIFHVERTDNKITLGTTGTTINVGSHTASLLLGLDASKNLESVSDLTAWIAGTTNQIIVIDDTDGTVTLSLSVPDILTDKWLNSNYNTFLGIDVAYAGDLTHSAGAEGYYNTFIGFQSGFYISSGSINTGVGSGSLTSLTIGTKNTGVGDNVLLSLTTGNYHTAIGQDAGKSVITVDSGVFLGYSAGRYETVANKLFIDNAPRTNEADGRVKALIYGVFAAATANQELHFNSKVEVLEYLTLPNIKSGANQAGAGAAANELWKTASHATLPDNVVMIGV